MVFTKDFVRDFYRVIQTDRVLVLVNNDVDAICAARIIQCLFTWDHVIHTIVPINGKQDLESAYLEHIEGVKYVLLINCGGCMDIVDLLQPDPEVVFFIVDSHRPLSVENIYNAVQTRIILKQEQVDQDIPEYEQVFRDDESDSDDEEEDEGGKKRRLDASYLERRQEKRIWQETRAQILSKYMSTCYTGMSAALIMYSTAYSMSQDTADMLWWAIIGVTSQYVYRKLDHDHYFDTVGLLQDHVSRISKKFDDPDGDYSKNTLRISFENDLMCDLYRHWNLYDSICNSLYTASHFRIWTLKGKSRFHEFLAVMGLSLAQCKQSYKAMDTSLRKQIKPLVMDNCEKFTLDSNSLFLPTFVASTGYKTNLSAVDTALVCGTILEDPSKTDISEKFASSMDLLHRSNRSLMDKGLEQAISIQTITMSQVQFLLGTNAITPTRCFLYAIITEGSPESIYFRSPLALERLAHFTLECFVQSDKCSRKRRELPLVLICPLGVTSDTSIVVGIPPIDAIKRDNCRNIFSEAFQHVAQNMACHTQHDYMDGHVILLKKQDHEKFLEGLLDVL